LQRLDAATDGFANISTALSIRSDVSLYTEGVMVPELFLVLGFALAGNGKACDGKEKIRAFS
jgi:hypothetical protein